MMSVTASYYQAVGWRRISPNMFDSSKLVWCYFAGGVISSGFQFIGPLAGSGGLKDRHVTLSYASSNNPCEGPYRFRRQISPSANQGFLRRSRSGLLGRVDRP